MPESPKWSILGTENNRNVNIVFWNEHASAPHRVGQRGPIASKSETSVGHSLSRFIEFPYHVKAVGEPIESFAGEWLRQSAF